MDNMTTNNENKSGISIGLDQLLPEENKSVQLGLNYGQNECNSQRVLKENNTKRGKGLFGKKGRGSNPFWKKTAKLYCVLSAVCAIVVMVTLYVTHGDFLSYFLYHDTLDAGMDFFHSIEYVRGRQPYAVFDTLYPPLANLFFYALFLLVPASVSDNWTYDFEASVAMRGTETDLRTTQSCFLLYVFFVVLAVLLLAVLLRDVMQNAQWARASTFFALFSFGVLNAVDRGNIILLAAGLSLFFVMYHRSKRAWVRELALVALAVAAGLKIYPAFLGVMLLRNRDFKAAIRTVFYGIAALVLPVFAFQEGVYGLQLWLKILFSFGSKSKTPWAGNGINSMFAHGAHLVDLIAGTSNATVSFFAAAFAVAAVLVVCALLCRQEWQALLLITVAMMYQSQGNYIYCMALIPLAYFLAQEKVMTRQNILPFAVLMVFNLPLPIFEERNSYIRNTIVQLAILTAIIWGVVQAVNCVLATLKTKKPEQSKLDKKAARSTLVTFGASLGALAVSLAVFYGVWVLYNAPSITMQLGDGIYNTEYYTPENSNKELPFYWCKKSAEIKLVNPQLNTERYTFTFTVGDYFFDISDRPSITITFGDSSQTFVVSQENMKIRYTADIPFGESTIDISYSGKRVDAPQDSRTLYFVMVQPQLERIK